MPTAYINCILLTFLQVPLYSNVDTSLVEYLDTEVRHDADEGEEGIDAEQ